MNSGMCCPTSDGAAAAVVCSEAFVKKHKLENQAIEIVSQGELASTVRSIHFELCRTHFSAEQVWRRTRLDFSKIVALLSSLDQT